MNATPVMLGANTQRDNTVRSKILRLRDIATHNLTAVRQKYGGVEKNLAS